MEITLMQIDWLSAIVATPPELWPGYETGRTLKLSPDGEILENRITAHQVEDDEPSSSRNFRVWTPSPGTLYLSGNPVKLIQGHNLWGSLDLYAYFLEAGLFVRNHAGLFPGPQTWQSCEFSAPRYTRIDITRSYRFRTDQEALDYVRHVVGHAKSRHGMAKLYGSGTAYFGQHSRRWSLKVYAKRQEMLAGLKGAARKLTSLVIADELLDWASGVVRFELTLRGLEMKKFGKSIDVHSPEALQKLWHLYFETIQFNENAAMTNNADLIEETLPGRLQGTLALWRTGRDLRAVLPKRTFYKHRSEILKACAVDIAVPPMTNAPAAPPRVVLDQAGWDPEPIAVHTNDPRGELKEHYPLFRSSGVNLKP
jgi:hypothetical protein